MPRITLQAFAVPIRNVNGVFDHTYVACSDGTLYGCFGGAAGGRFLMEGNGDSEVVECHSLHASQAGIYYGVTGVCHQATNRILASTGKMIDSIRRYDKSPSFVCATFLFGHYGLPWDAQAFGVSKPDWVEDWPDREKRCVCPNPGRLPMPPDQPSLGMKVGPYASFIRKRMKDQWSSPRLGSWTTEAIRERLKREILALLARQLRKDRIKKKGSFLAGQAEALYADRADLVRALIAGNMSQDEYVRQLNKLVDEMMRVIKENITQADYLDVFQVSVDSDIKVADESVNPKLPPSNNDEATG